MVGGVHKGQMAYFSNKKVLGASQGLLGGYMYRAGRLKSSRLGFFMTPRLYFVRFGRF